MNKRLLYKVTVKNTVNPADWLQFLSAAQRRELQSLVGVLRGRRIVHVNATAAGGGVAELLNSLVPYLRSIGIKSDWYTIDPTAIRPAFFRTTNTLHNALQGESARVSEEDWANYKTVSRQLADELAELKCDVLAVNDPQLLFAGYGVQLQAHKIYFSHIDTSSVFPPVWAHLEPAIVAYDRIVFSNREFIHPGLPNKKIKVFTPAIDPLAPKQRLVPKRIARQYLHEQAGIPLGRPLIVQVSRFDVWKNPLDVLRAFQIVQQSLPKAQLALVGFNTANDNPLSEQVYQTVVAAAGSSSSIFLFFDPGSRNVTEFTAMSQAAADVVVQNSKREGFGLVVTEAMWKGQPVIGGPASGIKKQITDGVTGFIVRSPEELAKKMLFLATHPVERRQMGRRARASVARRFLFPRLLLDHLRLYQSLYV